MIAEDFRCGFVAVIGRPNVGKSTLVNALLGRKLSIISHRAQTTRHRILGIRNTETSQVIFVDTPGLHHSERREINAIMNRTARASVEGVDLVLLVITARGWTADDEIALTVALGQPAPVVLVINKVDRLDNKEALLPLIQASGERGRFSEIVPVSAVTGANLDRLQAVIEAGLPISPPGFPVEQLTDRSDRFMAAELVREQLFNSLGQELPYETAVQVERMEHKGKLLNIGATIIVERPGQKGIVIGQGGERLKRMGSRARQELEAYFGCKVFLELWVKLRKDWTRSEQALRLLGYGEDL
jgi:GTP-binding protein Era